MKPLQSSSSQTNNLCIEINFTLLCAPDIFADSGYFPLPLQTPAAFCVCHSAPYSPCAFCMLIKSSMRNISTGDNNANDNNEHWQWQRGAED